MMLTDTTLFLAFSLVVILLWWLIGYGLFKRLNHKEICEDSPMEHVAHQIAFMGPLVIVVIVLYRFLECENLITKKGGGYHVD